MDYAIGGVAIAALIVGLVEFAKKRGVQDKGSQVLAFALGVIFVGLGHGMNASLIPEPYATYVAWFVVAISGGPAAMGYYDLGKKFLGK